MPKKKQFNPSGLQMTDEQEKIVDHDYKKGESVAVKAFAGTGKSQDVDCIVQTPNGPKRIGDIKVGDAVFASDGSHTTVVGVYPQGVLPTYKVSFRDKTHTYCNDEHLWNVQTSEARSKGRGYKTVKLKQIFDKGVKFDCGVYRYYIPLCSPVKYSHREYTIHPYILGCLLGDGYISHTTPVLTSKDRDIIDRILQVIDKRMYITEDTDNNDRRDRYFLSCNENQNLYKQELLRLDLHGKRSGDKFIPEVYKQGSIEQRLELLKGLMDTDGCIKKNRSSYSTISKRLALDVRELVQSLGGTAIIHENDRTNTGRKMEYEINIKMFVCPFFLPRKAEKWSFSKKNPPSRAIVNITKVDDREQVCIKVDADDELYLTDNFIVTHNTTTLQLLSNTLLVTKPKWKILYLAFNKSIQEEAQKKFGKNVICRTTHSMAFAEQGKFYRHKLKPKVRLMSIVKELDLQGRDKWDIARNAWYTVTNFIASGKVKIDIKMVPGDTMQSLRPKILKYASTIWRRMKDKDDKAMPMTHDGYLKLYQLSRPDISKEYDMIMVDEAQDSNPAVVDLVNHQKCAKVWIGDDHQSIYQFRGSSNAFKTIKIDHEYYLSQSFRFGENVAYVANALLRREKNERVPLVGAGGEDRIIKDVLDEDKYTIIHRTNSALFSNAVECLQSHNKFGIVGGADNSGIDLILDAYNVFSNNRSDIKDPFMKTFYDLDGMVAYARQAEDIEIMRMAMEVNKYKSDIPYLVAEIKKESVSIAQADIILTTAHKSKGLEFNTVILEDDFFDFTEEGEQDYLPPKEEEVNLLYVALTRAQKQLALNKSLRYVLEDFDENFTEESQSTF
jgi:F-box protein 18 (helicase)